MPPRASPVSRICPCLAEIDKAVPHALASQRKRMKAEIPPQGRGRPSKQRQAQARKAARQKKRVAGLSGHGRLLVRNGLAASRKKRPQGLARAASVAGAARDHGQGVPAVRQTLQDRDGAGEAGGAAEAGAPIQAPGQAEETGGSARPRRASASPGSRRVWSSAWRWTCGASSATPNASGPPRRCIGLAQNQNCCTTLAEVSKQAGDPRKFLSGRPRRGPASTSPAAAPTRAGRCSRPRSPSRRAGRR